MIRTWFCLLSFVAVASFAAGCGGGPAAVPPKGEAHDHPTTGPHKGHLIEFPGEEYHAELTHDDASKTITVYLLGSDAKVAVTSPDTEIALNLTVNGEPLQAKLTAAPQEGDKMGEASRFTLVDEKVLEALENPKTTCRLSVNLGGKPYNQPFELGAHGHDHDHK